MGFQADFGGLFEGDGLPKSHLSFRTLSALVADRVQGVQVSAPLGRVSVALDVLAAARAGGRTGGQADGGQTGADSPSAFPAVRLSGYNDPT